MDIAAIRDSFAYKITRDNAIGCAIQIAPTLIALALLREKPAPRDPNLPGSAALILAPLVILDVLDSIAVVVVGVFVSYLLGITLNLTLTKEIANYLEKDGSTYKSSSLKVVPSVIISTVAPLIYIASRKN